MPMTERQFRRASRLEAIRAYVIKSINRKLVDRELRSLDRLTDQDLHLIVATLDELSP